MRGRAGLDQVIEYLLQQQVMVVELEPEGEEDSGTYLQVSGAAARQRAGGASSCERRAS